MSGYRKKKKIQQKCGFKKWNMVNYVEKKVNEFGFHPYLYLVAEYRALLRSTKESMFLTSLPSDFDGDNITAYTFQVHENDPCIKRFITHNNILRDKLLKSQGYTNIKLFNKFPGEELIPTEGFSSTSD